MSPSLRITLYVTLPSGDYSLTPYALHLCLLCLMFCLILGIRSRSILTNLVDLVDILHLETCVLVLYHPTFLFLLLSIKCQHLTSVFLSTAFIANILGDPTFHIGEHLNIQPLCSLISSSPMTFLPPSLAT